MSKNYSKMNPNHIGYIFVNASRNGDDELLINDAKFIDLVNKKCLGKIIRNLCYQEKYDIAILLSENTDKIKLIM